MANSRINLTPLDFDTIKFNLKEYLKNQETFQDYDFEGSGLSVLLDILSYNTHYNAIYNNLSINEMFLDSARKRNSVVSLSKMLGYTPQSASCARALIGLTIPYTSTSPDIIVLPAYTPFTTGIDGTQYTFYTLSSYTAVKDALSSYYLFNDIEIVEGVPLTHSYTVSTGTKFVIPNANVDISTLIVKVYETANSSNITTYNFSDGIVNVDSTSTIYWVKEIDDGLYELTFGDGILGKSLTNGNIVEINYIISSLDAPNGARVFQYNGSTLYSGSPTPIIRVSSAASIGDSVESIDSIKFNAPRSYATQNRAVTIDDYKSLIYTNFQVAQSVSVWGGEDNTPPIYGKIFICIKPTNADILTDQEKSYVLNSILSPKNVLIVTPVIVDPEYIKLSMKVTVYYNELETTRSLSEISTIIHDAIISYNSTELGKFDSIFRYSKLSKAIDTCESSIINNISTILLHRALTPKYNVSAQYIVNLITPIYYSGVPEDIIVSTGFYVKGDILHIHYLVDDGVGNMQLFYTEGENRVITNKSIGSVNYSTGVINISNLNITTIIGDTLELTIKPQSNDVVSAYTQIVEIDTTRLNITTIPDKTAMGNSAGGTNYIFASSRT